MWIGTNAQTGFTTANATVNNGGAHGVVEKSGTTGIDIYPVGNDRSQVADLLDGVFVFFTDQGHQGGTDYTLAQRAQTVHHVGGWRETWDILKAQYAD
jgi:hypothetical protein